MESVRVPVPSRSTSKVGGSVSGPGDVRDLLSTTLGRPLQRPSADEFIRAWVVGDRDEGDIAALSAEFLTSTWDCFEMADWFVEARAGEISGRWSLSLRAVPRRRWAEVADVLAAADEESWDRAWALLPPTLMHPLFNVDVVLRHGGEPWARQTTRVTDPVAAPDWQAAVRRWCSEFVADLERADRWVGGEHLDSAALTSREVVRVKSWQLGMDLIVVPRDGEHAPGLGDVLGRVATVRPPRRRSRFTALARSIPSVWDVAEGRAGEALVLTTPALDRLTDSEMAATVDALMKAESDFWIYEVAARGPFAADDLADLWQRSCAARPTARAGARASAGDLQLVVASRHRDWTFDEIFERLDVSVEPRGDGLFGHLLGSLPGVWDVEEASAGDALLMEIPRGRPMLQADVDATALALDQAGLDFLVAETRTLESFTGQDVQQWWQEDQSG